MTVWYNYGTILRGGERKWTKGLSWEEGKEKRKNRFITEKQNRLYMKLTNKRKIQ